MTLDFVEIDHYRLRHFLEAQGLTRSSLAKTMHITTKTIQRWINGSVKKIRPETLADLARALGVKPEVLCKNTVVLEQRPTDRALEELCSERFLQRVRAVNEWESYRKILKTYVDRDIPTTQKMVLFKHIGFSSIFMGKMKSGKLHLDKSLKIAEALQDYSQQILILNWLAIHSELIGSGRDALPFFEKAEELLPFANNPFCDSDFYFKRGRILHHLEQHEQAVADIRRSICIDHRMGNINHVMVAVKYFHMGGSYLRARNFKKARVAFKRNLTFSEKGAWVRGQAYSHICMAVMDHLEGQPSGLVATQVQKARKLRNVSQFHKLDSKVEQIEFFYFMVNNLIAEAKKTVVKRLSVSRMSRLHFAYAVLDALFLAKLSPNDFSLRASFIEKAEELFEKNNLMNSLGLLRHLRAQTQISREDVAKLYYF